MIILASSSPRREELLKRAGFDFKIMVPDICEDSFKNNQLAPSAYVKEIAYHKALAVFKAKPNDLVIAADTIVVFNDLILEKPKDDSDAVRMLKLLANNTHQVYTAVCIFYQDKVSQFCEVTTVKFKKISIEQIYSYVASGEPIGKAGSYGIQGSSRSFVESYDGNLSNVIGLPIEQTTSIINQLLQK